MARTCREGRKAVIRYAIDQGGYGHHATRDMRPRLVSVGRFRAPKDFDTLLEAFAIVVREQPDARLLLVGDGSERDRIARLAREHQRLELRVETVRSHPRFQRTRRARP